MVRDLLRREADEAVHGIILWVPVLPGDMLSEARAQATLLDGDRVVHLWDGMGAVNRGVASALSLTGPGWDLYLIYRKGVRWVGGLLPAPTFWMHQLSPEVGADPARYLCRYPERLAQALDDLRAT